MENHNRNFVLSFLSYAAQRDISLERLCSLSNISFETLKENNEKVLTEKQINDLWKNAIYLTKDELFGLHFGESLQLSALGIIGELIKSSNTIGEAIETACTLTHLVTDQFSLTVKKGEENFRITFVPKHDNWLENAVSVQLLDMLMAISIHEMDGLALKKIVPLNVYYSGRTDNNAELDRVMRCKTTTTENHNAIAFDIHYWEEPILTKNYELQKILLQKTSATPQKKTFKTHIYDYLMSNSYLGLASLEQVASNYNMSARTLQRKLKEEGTSFHKVTDESRKTLAINYLKSGQHPIKEIAWLLGYSEISTFTRTFKRMTGTSPVYYQRENKKMNSTMPFSS